MIPQLLCIYSWFHNQQNHQFYFSYKTSPLLLPHQKKSYVHGNRRKFYLPNSFDQIERLQLLLKSPITHKVLGDFQIPSCYQHQLNIQIFDSMAENKSLYDRLGGHDAIKSVVDKFYVYMLDDPRVKEFFKNSDMTKQRKKQTDFISMATGGPNNYEGMDMKKAHLNMKIGHKEFDATWENLEKSLHDHKVGQGLIKEVRQVFYSVEDEVIQVK